MKFSKIFYTYLATRRTTKAKGCIQCARVVQMQKDANIVIIIIITHFCHIVWLFQESGHSEMLLN